MSDSNFIKYSFCGCPDCGEKIPHTKLLEVAKERKEKGKKAWGIIDEMIEKLRNLEDMEGEVEEDKK